VSLTRLVLHIQREGVLACSRHRAPWHRAPRHIASCESTRAAYVNGGGVLSVRARSRHRAPRESTRATYVNGGGVLVRPMSMAAVCSA
jgi:hypothetical protein